MLYLILMIPPSYEGDVNQFWGKCENREKALPAVFCSLPCATSPLYLNLNVKNITPGRYKPNRKDLPVPHIPESQACNVLAVGNDIVSVPRIRSLISKKNGGFVARSFTCAEISQCYEKSCPEIHFAGKWAAKESVYKALNLRWDRSFSWKEIEIISSGRGAPCVVLSDSITAGLQDPALKLLISISHCRDYAFATALAVQDAKE